MQLVVDEAGVVRFVRPFIVLLELRGEDGELVYGGQQAQDLLHVRQSHFVTGEIFFDLI